MVDEPFEGFTRFVYLLEVQSVTVAVGMGVHATPPLTWLQWRRFIEEGVELSYVRGCQGLFQVQIAAQIKEEDVVVAGHVGIIANLLNYAHRNGSVLSWTSCRFQRFCLLQSMHKGCVWCLNGCSDMIKKLPRLAPWILVAAGAVYANSLDGPFIYDDQAYIVENESIRQLWPATWMEQRMAHRPVGAFTFALNYALGGLDVVGYHVVKHRHPSVVCPCPVLSSADYAEADEGNISRRCDE